MLLILITLLFTDELVLNVVVITLGLNFTWLVELLLLLLLLLLLSLLILLVALLLPLST